jgi:hypothetical protein
MMSSSVIGITSRYPVDFASVGREQTATLAPDWHPSHFIPGCLGTQSYRRLQAPRAVSCLPLWQLSPTLGDGFRIPTPNRQTLS